MTYRPQLRVQVDNADPWQAQYGKKIVLSGVIWWGGTVFEFSGDVYVPGLTEFDFTPYLMLFTVHTVFE